MRKPLIAQVPEIWRRLDTDGVLSRFLGVIDTELDSRDAKIGELFDLRSVDRVPDRYLPLLASLVGHVWRSERGYPWNRRRIRNAIRRWSYKSTEEMLGDLVLDNGGGDWSVTDNESRLIIWDRQGSWDTDDCHWQAADYWHDGAFVLRIPRSLDYEGLIADLAETLAAGEVWYFEVTAAQSIAYIAEWSQQRTEYLVNTNAQEHAIEFGAWDMGLYLDFDSQPRAAKSFWPIIWHPQRTEMGALWDVAGSWDMDLYTDFDPAIAPQYWSYLATGAVAGAYLTANSNLNVGRTDIDIGDGSFAEPLSDSHAVIQKGTQKSFIEI